MGLSDEFKEKLLAPIDALFEDACEPERNPRGRNSEPFGDPQVFNSVGKGEPSGSRKRDSRTQRRKWKIDEEALELVLSELYSLVGQSEVKKSLSRLVELVRVTHERKRLKMKSPAPSCHMVFTGNPGTGKTTVARLVGRLLGALGILSKGHTVEVCKADLVGGYLGQTPLKTNEAVDSALGGVLFVDEAYSLFDDKEDLYGREAVTTLLKRMEDDRQRFVLIVAGYPRKMERFIGSNPGLSSRFNRFVPFDDYSVSEMQAIFGRLCGTAGFEITPGFMLRCECTWESMMANGSLSRGNARFARTAFDLVLENQAVRLRDAAGKREGEGLQAFDPRDWEGIEEALSGGALRLEEKWDAEK